MGNLTDADLTQLQWRAPEWITALNGLRTDNVLEYFSKSPFYDRHCNNEILRMQSQFNAHFTSQTLLQDLKTMKGIEFIIDSEKPPDLWVIKKQNRVSPTEVTLLAIYFVANDNIYMAPDAHSVVSSRVLSMVYSLRKAMQIASELAQFSAEKGHSYPSDPPPKDMEYDGTVMASQALANSLNYNADYLDIDDVGSRKPPI